MADPIASLWSLFQSPPAPKQQVELPEENPLTGWRQTGDAAIRGLLGAIGMGDDSTAARAGEFVTGVPSAAIMALKSPFRSVAMRTMAHTKLKESALNQPAHVRQRVQQLIDDYPMYTSHIKTDTKLGSPTATGGFTPQPTPHDAPRGVMTIHPGIPTGTPEADELLERVFAHEGTHGARMLRHADRARRRGDPIPTTVAETPLMQEYNRLESEHGYFRNPEEVRARVNEELAALRDTPMSHVERRKLAEKRASDTGHFLERMNIEANILNKK